jgi:hypothetical protein
MNIAKQAFCAVRNRINEPRDIRVFLFLIYFLALIGGVSALDTPPQSVEGELGITLSYIWAGFITLGGFAGIASVNGGRWWLERIACMCAAVGTALYTVVLVALEIGGDRGTNGIPAACLIGITILVFGYRAWRIRGFDYEPRR